VRCFFTAKGTKCFAKDAKGVLKGINGLLMCGAGKAPGVAEPLLWFLESSKFGNGLVKKCWRMNCWRTCRAYGSVKERPGGKIERIFYEEYFF